VGRDRAIWKWGLFAFAFFLLTVCALSSINSYASSVGATHYSTSAKMNKGLDELFLDITKRICRYASVVPVCHFFLVYCFFLIVVFPDCLF